MSSISGFVVERAHAPGAAAIFSDFGRMSSVTSSSDGIATVFTLDARHRGNKNN